MTRVYDNPSLAGQPVTRALVIGVGAYPKAKEAFAGPTTPQPLRKVSDLPGAATGAALFCDWLITNGAQLTPPLASVDLLMNIEAGGQHFSAYSWTNRITAPAGGVDPRPDTAVQPPETDRVRDAGTAWMTDLQQGAGNQAIFYICGHGAVLGPDSLVFLSDLNAFPGNPWGALINVSNHARAFTQMSSLASAVFLVDACGELVVDLLKVNPGVGAQFAYNDPQNSGEEKVTVLAAAAPGRLTYDGALPDAPGVRAGRFTQCLIQGLNGAAVRDITGQGDWSIHPQGLFQDLKALYRLRDDWVDRPFDPTPPIMPADEFPILRFVQPPEVPVRVRLAPPQDAQWTFSIHHQKDAILRSRDLGAPADWLTSVPASLTPHTFLGVRPGNGSVTELRLERAFNPINGRYDQKMVCP